MTEELRLETFRSDPLLKSGTEIVFRHAAKSAVVLCTSGVK
jgi:hypothetical protein